MRAIVVLVALALLPVSSAFAPAPALPVGLSPIRDLVHGDATRFDQAVALVDRATTAREASDALALVDAPVGSDLARALLDTGVALRAAHDAGAPAPELVRLALAAQQAPASQHALPVLAHFAGLAPAIDALHASYEQRAPDELREAAARVDRDEPAVGAALARIVAAQILAQEAASSRYGAHDVGYLVAVRNIVALEVAQAMLGVACIGFPLPPSAVMSVDLVCTDTDHGESVPLLIDAGGNDVYNGGTAGVGSGDQAAIAVDLAGDDVYWGGNGMGSWHGLGLLFDAAGNDRYSTTLNGNGAGFSGGAGFLLDEEGNDAYSSYVPPWDSPPVAANGGAGTLTWAGDTEVLSSVGMLIDLAGDDAYSGTNGAGMDISNWAGETVPLSHLAALGALVDVDGADQYYSNGFLGNGAGEGKGLGVLLDVNGDDAYGGSQANGAAFAKGIGILADLAGDDDYSGNGNGGWNGGGVWGEGFLLDLAGNDHYRGGNGFAVASGTADGAVGLIEGRRATGLLYDASGDDIYVAPAGGPVSAGNGGGWGPGAMGLLLDASGDDSYEADSGVTQGAGYDGGVGMLVDQGGANSFVAYDNIAQGVGMSNGAGILVDQGDRSTFKLSGSAVGQGAGILGGVGMLLVTAHDAITTYEAAPTARPSREDGGIALRLSAGRSVYVGLAPSVACNDGAQLAGDSRAVAGHEVEASTCAGATPTAGGVLAIIDADRHSVRTTLPGLGPSPSSTREGRR